MLDPSLPPPSARSGHARLTPRLQGTGFRSRILAVRSHPASVAARRWTHDRAEDWRSGTRRSQVGTLAALLAAVVVFAALTLVNYELFPVSGSFVWLLVGMLLLRHGPLLVLSGTVVVSSLTTLLVQLPAPGSRVTGTLLLLLSVGLVTYQSSRQRSGLPTPLSEAFLADLRDRVDAQGRVPALPDGWDCQTAMLAAYGVGYAGDFMVADLSSDKRHLELVLVDVCGKGVSAGPTALMFSGALGGLLGSVSGPALLEGANRFLLRQESEETMATAVHVRVDLGDGTFVVHSAGHPPALHRHPGRGSGWTMGASRGIALGVLDEPELYADHGALAPGDSLLFYTDGVVESRRADLEVGITWLCETTDRAAAAGHGSLASRVVAQVPRGDDDRALLVLTRSPSPT